MELSSLYVTVIEPSKVQRQIITGHLNSFGIEQIEEFEEARPALNHMLSSPPDLVLSSMHLPDITGTELVTQMRGLNTLQDITFLLVSSETHYRYLEPIRQAGAIAILPKPFSREEMGVALRSTLDYITDFESESDNDDYEALNVLIVDDSSLSRKYIQQMLKSLSIHSIQTAKDGSEALELINQGNLFDLIITDYNMPNIDGKELTEHIRTASEQPTVPILMMTSEQNESRLAAIQSAGVSALCSKPLSYDTVKHLIEQLVTEF
ncbi:MULTISPECIES: response regulator [unclassified Neptuniibacter]|jgi:two-component system chemotaxis response regulator CheY|uniref:response regulator n=1 Tax=unclassified Neptuniibacter TaxID=2630693 RepID=UPI0026E17909|nr:MULTISPECIES: response regulator [unclassified Neptuniibacter]MDO6513438.1 response regulator [Neptuniibacter sp. 2_MG-2023]MDO6593967.1 response regulator [Neptuniibacter sp. 1_MG-2023]